MALLSDIHEETQNEAAILGYESPGAWNWKSSSGVKDQHDVIVLTDATLFVTHEISSDGARKLLMAAAEGDLAVAARAAVSKHPMALPLVDIVEVSWASSRRVMLLHTSSGRAVTIAVPDDEIAEEICQAVASKAGYGKRTVIDLGRTEQSKRPYSALAGGFAICIALAVLYKVDPQWASNIPTLELLCLCVILMVGACLYALNRLAVKNERITIAIDRRRSAAAA